MDSLRDQQRSRRQGPNADVRNIKVIFVDEPDNIINLLGIKRLGEIGIVGVAAGQSSMQPITRPASARDLPITLDKYPR
jgi:xanthine dehydrogenase YagR molybdenum-binding subunit